MVDKLESAFRSAEHAFTLIVEHTASVDPWLVALGVVLHVVSQVVRTRGWHTILEASYPGAPGFRPKHTAAAYLAGAGFNAVIPARGGDIVKLALLRRRIEGSRYPTLAATFVPETLFETLFGIALVVWALAMGFLPVPTSSGELPQIDVSFLIDHPIRSLVILGGLAIAGWLLLRFARRHIDDLRERFAQGVVILGRPRDFVVGVASWQALARVIRLGSLAAFMAAFGLPVTVETVVLVMAAQGGGRIIPLAPVSAGLRLAMLSYGFVEVTGQAVDIAAITAFTFGVSAVLLVAGLVVGLSCLAMELGTANPLRLRAALRAYRMSTGVPTGTRG